MVALAFTDAPAHGELGWGGAEALPEALQPAHAGAIATQHAILALGWRHLGGRAQGDGLVGASGACGGPHGTRVIVFHAGDARPHRGRGALGTGLPSLLMLDQNVLDLAYLRPGTPPRTGLTPPGRGLWSHSPRPSTSHGYHFESELGHIGGPRRAVTPAPPSRPALARACQCFQCEKTPCLAGRVVPWLEQVPLPGQS